MRTYTTKLLVAFCNFANAPQPRFVIVSYCDSTVGTKTPYKVYFSPVHNE